MTYREKQDEVRNQAIDYQCDFANHDYSWEEVLIMEKYFEKMGKRYGLLREFHENGIC